ALAALLQLLVGDLPTGLGLTGLAVSPAFGYAGVGFPTLGMNAFAYAWSAILPLRWYMAVLARPGSARPAGVRFRPPVCRARGAHRALRAAGAVAAARGRGTAEPPHGGRRCGAARRRARRRRCLRGRMATRARDPRRVYPADRRAADLRHLCPLLAQSGHALHMSAFDPKRASV